MSEFALEILASDGAARRGRLQTAHGTMETPAFMPVGTAGTVKAMTADAVAATGAEMVLGNTYHLMLRPGAETIQRLGGLHAFMNWPGPILTDSGGFQVMSLSKLRTMTDDGVTFQSHIDGASHTLTPESSVQIQAMLDNQLQEVAGRFIPALQRALPKLPPEDLFWRIHFLVGAMAHTMADAERLREFTGGMCDPDDTEETVRQLVTFLEAGLKAR